MVQILFEIGDRCYSSNYPFDYKPDLFSAPVLYMGAVVRSVGRNGKLTILCDDGIYQIVNAKDVRKGEPPCT